MSNFIKAGYRAKENAVPMGTDFNKLMETLEAVLEENKAIRDELANLNCPHPLMTKQCVAEYFQVSVRTIEKMVKDGELNPVMIKSLPRFKRQEIERYAQRASVKLFSAK